MNQGHMHEYIVTRLCYIFKSVNMGAGQTVNFNYF